MAAELAAIPGCDPSPRKTEATAARVEPFGIGPMDRNIGQRLEHHSEGHRAIALLHNDAVVRTRQQPLHQAAGRITRRSRSNMPTRPNPFAALTDGLLPMKVR